MKKNKFSWRWDDNNKIIFKILDHSCFHHNESTIVQDFYSYFQIIPNNTDSIKLTLIDENNNRYKSRIDHTRKKNPVRQIHWLKDFETYLKNKVSFWKEIKPHVTRDYPRLYFQRINDGEFKVSIKLKEKSSIDEIRFIKNKLYKRIELHEKYGGRGRYGISNSPKFPIIFIFSNPKEKQDVYSDRWDEENKYFYYSGEGRKGDMEFKGGNKSILNHKEQGKKIHLFYNTKKSGYWEYIDELKLISWDNYFNKGEDGKRRKGIQFKLLSITQDHEEIINEDHKKDSEEGRVTYKYHKRIERDGTLPKRKKKKVLEQLGYLSCEVCNFNFTDKYGDRGRDYIECHHNIPVSELNEGDVTKLSDLSLLCSNCHRMIHRKKPWLSIDELKEIIN